MEISVIQDVETTTGSIRLVNFFALHIELLHEIFHFLYNQLEAFHRFNLIDEQAHVVPHKVHAITRLQVEQTVLVVLDSFPLRK